MVEPNTNTNSTPGGQSFIESLPIKQEDKARLYKQLEQNKHSQLGNRIIRSTYTENNSRIFKGFFDEILKTQEDREILYSSLPNIKSNTLYQKATDALRWLCDNEVDIDLRRRYILIRAAFVFKRGRDSLMFIKRGAGSVKLLGRPLDTVEFHGVVVDVNEEGKKNETTLVLWKNKIEHFIETGEINKQVVIPTGVTLTQDDLIWLSGMCGGIKGMDYLVDGNSIILIKEEGKI